MPSDILGLQDTNFQLVCCTDTPLQLVWDSEPIFHGNIVIGSPRQCLRICKLIKNLELSLWHDVMHDKPIFHACTKKMIQKRGGNLAAPLPRNNIGECGYLNDITDDQLSQYVDEYHVYVTNGTFARNGYGVEPLLDDVGIADTSAEAIAMV